MGTSFKMENMKNLLPFFRSMDLSRKRPQSFKNFLQMLLVIVLVNGTTAQSTTETSTRSVLKNVSLSTVSTY